MVVARDSQLEIRRVPYNLTVTNGSCGCIPVDNWGQIPIKPHPDCLAKIDDSDQVNGK
jgi:hypothetical protein